MSTEVSTEPAEGVEIPESMLSETVSRLMSFDPGPSDEEKARTVDPAPAKPGTQTQKPQSPAPPEKPGEKKPETPPEPKKPDVPADLATTAADEAEYKTKKAGDWKLLKSEREKFRSEAESTRKELETVRGQLQKAQVNGAPREELDALRKERDQLSDHLQRVSLENHPKFQAYFKGNGEKLMAQAKQIVGQETGAKLERVLSLPDDEYRAGQLEELYSNLNTSQQGRLASVLTRMDELRAERETELGKWKENYAKLQESEKAERDQRVQEAHQLFDRELAEAQTKLEVFMPREGDEAWNVEIKHRIDTARQLFSGESNPQELARAAIWAAAAPVYRALLGRQKQEIANLEAQIKELTAAGPRLPNGDGAGKTTASMGFVERVLAGQ